MGIISAFSILVIFASLIVFYAVKAPHQWKVLLGASVIYFGLYSPLGMLIVLASALISYFGAKAMCKAQDSKKQRLILLAELVYFVLSWILTKSLLSGSDKIFLISTYKLSETVITLGCSYFVLRYISYSYDVYKGKTPPEGNFFKLLLYYCYFPALVQGPIERYNSFNRVLFPEQKIRLSYENIKNAGVLVLTGLFKVYVLSKFCGLFTAQLNASEGVNALILILGIFLYSIQIFTDFSGGIDIVRGFSYLYGIPLSQNFRSPYLSQSFSEFWKRWHMTFSAWLKDYIYIPLGGSRKGKVRGYLNLMVVFAVSAVWHGFGVTFLIWGGLQALYVLVGRLRGTDRKRYSSPTEIPLWKYLLNGGKVFLLSTFSWIFFNASSLGSVRTLFASIASSFGILLHSGTGAFLSDFATSYIATTGMKILVILLYMLVLLISVILHIVKDRTGFDLSDSKKVCGPIRWIYYFLLLTATMALGFYGDAFSSGSFIYGAF